MSRNRRKSRKNLVNRSKHYKEKAKKVVLKEAGDVAMGPSFDFYNREVFGGVLDKKVEVSWASFDVLGAYHDTAGVTWHVTPTASVRYVFS